MKKTLVLIRHAKSSWTAPLNSDFDRPLNERGEHDAPRIGKRMSDLKLFPDLILASPAKRTAQTAELLARELHYSAEQIEYQEKLYHGSPSVLLDIIISLPAHVNLVFIVAHNPGLTEFANQLIPNFYVDNMPTCSFVAANVENGGWEDFANANVKLLLFETPKKL